MGYKQFFLLSPVLWLRKLILYLLASMIILAILVYVIANSPWVIQKAIDQFAPDYNITYSRIYGNVLTGIKIDDIKYNDQFLAKNASLKWNPDDLLKKQIVLNHVNLTHVNIDTIKGLVTAFSSDSNESSSPFSFSVFVAKANITIDPFVEEGIAFHNIVLNAQDVSYSSDEIEVKSLGVALDSNITKITLNASLQEGILSVEKLDIQDLDTLAIEKFILSDANESTSSNVSENTEEESANPLIPSEVRVKSLTIAIIPVVYDPIDIKSLKLKMKDGIFDTSTLLLKKANINLATETNFANAVHTGNIKNNQLLGMLKVIPKEALFTQYNLPLERTSVGEIDISVDASEERVIASVDTNMTQVLKADKEAFNVDINSLISTVTYVLKEGTLKADTKAKVSTPYAKNIMINNLFMMDDNISYRGDVFIKQIIGVDAKFIKPANDLQLQYVGDEKSIDAIINSNMLEGEFISNDFKTASLHLKSKEALLLRDFVELPTELNASKANVVIDIPLNFESNGSYVATAKIVSNLANIDAKVTYKETLHLTSVINVPKDSLLRPYSEALKWDALMPVKVEADLLAKSVEAKIQAGELQTKVEYDLNTTEVKGMIHLGGLKANVSGIAEKEMKVDSTITDIPSLMKSVSNIYTLDELPKVEGSVNISLSIKELKEARLSLKSPLVVYHSDHKSSMDISDLDVLLHYEENKLLLDHYAVTVAKEKIYATKPSIISLDDNIITLKPLWVNDALKAEGTYDLKTKKGKVVAQADKLHISHELIDLDGKVDITTLLDGNKTEVKGKIILLGGDIHYDLSQKSFASDSDIIIVQDMKSEQRSPFMENLSVGLQIETKSPLVYKKDAINIKANVDLGVHKVEHTDLLVLGTVEVLKGGTYIFQDKRFVLDKSFIHFTGNPSKPLLDIKVKYKALNHMVTISITGSADLPHITFASKPSLNKEQILSLILFDTEAGAGTNSGDDMMKMMGGAMAKSVLNNIGIKLDHLVLGEGNSIEVGKKLTDKITIIYVNDIVSEVKLKYKHGSHTESVIGASEISESYDIVYKLDF